MSLSFVDPVRAPRLLSDRPLLLDTKEAYLNQIMTQMQLHTTCDDCSTLVQHATNMLQSSGEVEVSILCDTDFHSRLLANAASSKCRMCTILCANFPRLSKPVKPGEVLQLKPSRSHYNPLAVDINLLEFEEASGILVCYLESLRVQEGEVCPEHGKMRANLWLSWTRQRPNSPLLPDVVPRNIELHSILAEKLHVIS